MCSHKMGKLVFYYVVNVMLIACVNKASASAFVVVAISSARNATLSGSAFKFKMCLIELYLCASIEIFIELLIVSSTHDTK